MVSPLFFQAIKSLYINNISYFSAFVNNFVLAMGELFS